MGSRVEGSMSACSFPVVFIFDWLKFSRNFDEIVAVLPPRAEGCGSALPGLSALLWHFCVTGSRTHCRTSHDGWQLTPDRLKFTRKVMPFDLEHSRDYMNFEANRISLRKSVMGMILFHFEYLPRNKRSVFPSQIIDFYS